MSYTINSLPYGATNYSTDKTMTKTRPRILLLVAIAGLLVGGYFFVNNQQATPIASSEDKDGKTYYTLSEDNQLTNQGKAPVSIPYGAKVTLVSKESATALVEYEGRKGSMDTSKLLEPDDFLLLNSILSGNNVRQNLLVDRCRRALLDYCKENKISGRTDSSAAGLLSGFDNGWAIVAKQAGTMPNAIFYPSDDKGKKRTDMAIILTKTASRQRRFVLFTFDNENNTSALTYAKELNKLDFVDEISPRLVIASKEDMTLRMSDSKQGEIVNGGMACGLNYGTKQKKGDMKTPEGVFTLIQKQDASTWTHDFGDGKGEIKNAYGKYFVRLKTPGFTGIGIHGTHNPQSIGTRATEGCMRLGAETLESFVSQLELPTTIVVIPSQKDLGK